MKEYDKIEKALEHYNAYKKIEQEIADECFKQIKNIKTRGDVFRAFDTTNRLFGKSITLSKGAEDILNKIYEIAFDLGIYNEVRINNLRNYLQMAIQDISEIIKNKSFPEDEYVISNSELVYTVTNLKNYQLSTEYRLSIDEVNPDFIDKKHGEDLIKGFHAFVEGKKINLELIPAQIYFQKKLEQLKTRWQIFLQKYVVGEIYEDSIYQQNEKLTSSPHDFLFCYAYEWLNEQVIVVGNYKTIIDGMTSYNPRQIVAFANHFLLENGIREELTLESFGYPAKLSKEIRKYIDNNSTIETEKISKRKIKDI